MYVHIAVQERPLHTSYKRGPLLQEEATLPPPPKAHYPGVNTQSQLINCSIWTTYLMACCVQCWPFPHSQPFSFQRVSALWLAPGHSLYRHTLSHGMLCTVMSIIPWPASAFSWVRALWPGPGARVYLRVAYMMVCCVQCMVIYTSYSYCKYTLQLSTLCVLLNVGKWSMLHPHQIHGMLCQSCAHVTGECECMCVCVCVHSLVCVHSCKHPSLQEEGTLPSLLKHRHACMHHLNLLHIQPHTQLNYLPNGRFCTVAIPP